MSGLVGHPAGLLWVVGLGLQLDLQLRGNRQPRGWIRVWALALLDVTGHGRRWSSYGIQETIRRWRLAIWKKNSFEMLLLEKN